MLAVKSCAAKLRFGFTIPVILTDNVWPMNFDCVLEAVKAGTEESVTVHCIEYKPV